MTIVVVMLMLIFVLLAVISAQLSHIFRLLTLQTQPVDVRRTIDQAIANTAAGGPAGP